MKKPYKSYNEVLIEALKDPQEAAEYLNTSLEEGDPKMFLVALKNVAHARGGIVKLAHQTKLGRANLYRIFSKQGNPEIRTLTRILNTFGLRLAVAAPPKSMLKAA